jgi:ParB-like chromosome segregation protein Spo0J
VEEHLTNEEDVELRFYPAANLLPLLEDHELDALVTDIRTHGLREPIVLFEGAILDGRNRYRACQKAGVVPHFEHWTPRHPDDTPLAFVLSRNLDRRHLNESQRAMIAARLANLPDGLRKDHAQGASIEAPTSQVEAARRLNVGRPSVQRAATLLRKGVPELIAIVDRGCLSVSRASALVGLSAAEQVKIATAVDPQREALRAFKQRRQSNSSPGAATPSIAQLAAELENVPTNSLLDRVLLLRDERAASSHERAQLADGIRAAAARFLELASQLQALDVCANRYCNRASGGPPRERRPGEKYCSRYCAEQAYDRAAWNGSDRLS